MKARMVALSLIFFSLALGVALLLPLNARAVEPGAVQAFQLTGALDSVVTASARIASDLPGIGCGGACAFTFPGALAIGWVDENLTMLLSNASGKALSNTTNQVVVGDGTPASCTRSALASALAAPGNLLVTFNCGSDPHTIIFNASIQLQANSTYVIDGGGVVTLDGNNAVGIFVVPATTSLTLVQLTIQGASCRFCGAINNYGALEIRSSVLRDNAQCCSSGGPLFAQAGSTTLITNTLVTLNALYDDAGGPMGAIYIYPDAAVEVVNSEFSSNWTGAFSNQGSLTIRGSELHSHAYSVVQMNQNAALWVYDSVFYNNWNTSSALNQSGRGAAIGRLGGATFTVNIYDSVFEQNQARLDGGAIYAHGTLNIYNSLFFDNAVLDSGIPAGAGGAIRMDANGVISNTEFIQNTAAGGGAVSISAASVTIHSSQFLTNTSTNGSGGALLAQLASVSSLEITESVFRNNTTNADGGAGVLKASSILVQGTTFDNNRSGYWASTRGGALFLEPPCCGGPKPNVSIHDSQFTGNRAGSIGGGAVWTTNLNLDIRRSVFEFNQADSGRGGALSLNPQTQAVIQNSLVANNLATGSGGGGGVFLSDNANATLVNVTLSANEADFGGNIARTPGGNDFNSTLYLYNVTLADGVARLADGGGNLLAHINGSTALRNTILSGGVTNGVPNNCSAPRTNISQGYNLETLNTCGLNGAGDQLNTDPLLSPLTGTTGLEALPYTVAHLLLEGSPAIDAGNPAGCFSDLAATIVLDHDQRTAPRPADGDDDGAARCDIGAVENLIPNIPPTLAGPPAQTLPEDYILTFSPDNQTAFTLDDQDAGASILRLSVAASHGQVTLGQVAGLTFLVGNGVNDPTLAAEGTLAALQAALLNMYLVSLPDYTGAASLLVEVNDLSHPAAGGPGLASHVVPIFYTPVNDAPRLLNAPPYFLYLQEDQAFVFEDANRFELYDPDIYSGTLRVTLSLGAGAALSLASQQGLVFTHGDGITDTYMTWQATLTDTNAALSRVQLHLAPDYNGQTALALQVSDGGSSGAGGVKTLDAFFSIFVAPVNDPPVHTLPPPQTTPPNTDLYLYASDGNRLAVADVDVSVNTPISITLRAENGTLALNPSVIGLNFNIPYSGDNPVISFKGRIDLINRALNGLRFRPTSGYSGPAAIHIASNDQGNTGGPPNITRDTLPITVLGAPYVAFTREVYSAAENAGEGTLVVRLFNGNPAFSYQVSYAFTSQTAIAGEDYIATDGVLIFEPGQAEHTISFTILNDNVHEPDVERLLVSLHSPSSVLTLGEPAQAAFDIINDDPAPVVSFASRRLVVNETDGVIQVTVKLSHPSQHNVQVSYLLAEPDPYALVNLASPDDYIFTPGTLHFPAGETTRSFPVTIVNDTIRDEGDEIVGFKLANLVNAVFGMVRSVNGLPTHQTDNQMTLVIADDDTPVVLFEYSGGQYDENSPGQKEVVVKLVPPSSQTVRVTCAVGGGTATRTLDYEAVRLQTITFAPGQVIGSCYFTLLDDDLQEPDETFSIVLQNPQNARLETRSEYVAHIKDNDAPLVCVDFVADKTRVIQVVQTIQGYENQDIPLIAGRQTFVRFAPYRFVQHSNPACRNRPPDYVRIDMYANGQRLEPLNSRPISSQANPEYVRPQDGFTSQYWFELPAHMRQGALNLVARVNADQAIEEQNYNNNEVTLGVSFVSPPRTASLVVYKVSYQVCPPFQPCTIVRPKENDLPKTLELMQNHYPVSLIYQTRSVTMPPAASKPTPGQIMVFLSGLLTRDIASGATAPGTIYAGLVSDHSGLTARRMDGSTFKIAGQAFGLTMWVNDESSQITFLHELAHVHGRKHVDAPTNIDWRPCSKPEHLDSNYPHEDGLLGSNQQRFVGFNIQDKETYWYNRYSDVMTYCSQKWISSYTWSGIINHVNNLPNLLRSPGVADPVLLFSAAYDAVDNQLDFFPLYVLPEAQPEVPPAASDYHLVLRSAGGELLESVPLEVRDDSAYEGGAMVLFTQAVALPGGVELLEVTGPGGVLLGSVQASPNPPTLTLTAPLLFEQVSPYSAVLQPTWPAPAPETRGAEVIQLDWQAGDPDGNPLYFAVLFSQDNGQSWRTLASDLISPTLTISRSQLSASPAARLRVMASDGLHTVYVDTGAFAVPNQPPDLGLVYPAPESVFLAGQTIPLRAWATDPDFTPPDPNSLEDNAPDEIQISWTSSISGLLGTGSVLPVQLAPGDHTITLRAVDSHGDAAELFFNLRVVTDTALLPHQPTELRISPDDGLIVLSNQPGETAAMFEVYNLDYSNPLTWTAATTATWLSLSAATGRTPDSLLVSLAPNHGLPFGTHLAELIISSPGDTSSRQNAPDENEFVHVVKVYVVISPYRVYLPLLNR